MVKVVVDLDELKNCKIHPMIIRMAAAKMSDDPHRIRSSHVNGKWVDVVEVYGLRYVATLRNEGEHDTFTRFRRAQHKK